MKKLSVSLIVLMMATMASANVVDIILVDEGSGVLGVYCDVVDACSTDVPVAYSLAITLSDGASADPCDITYMDPCYPVHIDYMHDELGAGF